MSRLQIQPQYLSLGELLSNRLFRIPDYQRAYSWEWKQRSDLFEDITKTQDKGRETQHFMATVVALRRTSRLIGTDQHQIVEVVDGQQRLTTIIILLKSIEQALDRSVPAQQKIADELMSVLVKPDSQSLLLLQTNHDTSHYFSNYLRDGTHSEIAEAKTTADRQILSAIVECEDFVQDWLASHKLLTLLTLLKNRLTFVLHEIDDESIVYTVFEVLNSRGLDVSWLDRLKSVLMGGAFGLKSGRKEVIDELHRIWRDIYSCVGLRIGMSNETLRFAATLASNFSQNKTLGEEESVETLYAKSQTAKQILDTARWLLKVTKACDKIIENPRLNGVVRISHARLLAVAINLRTDLSSAQRTELLRIWENVTFRIFGMFGNDARMAVGDYVRLAWQVIYQKPDYDQTVELLKELGSEYPIADAVEQLRNKDCYDGWQEDLRYFFFRYEEYLSIKGGQNFSNEQWERIWLSNASDSIEHIWAQSKAPLKQMHRLGNFVLLPPKLNSKLQDKPPRQKRDAYTKTGMLIAQQVAKDLSKRWTTSAIDKREKRLLNWARRRWAD